MLSTARDARLSIEVTRRCNGACIHCFAGAGDGHAAEISRKTLEDIVQEGARAGFRHLHLTGGEPLIHPGIHDLLGLVADCGYETVLLNTNGMGLDRTVARRLAAFSQLTLSISLEVNEHLHERWRGKGTHRAVIKGLKCCLDAQLPAIVYTLVSRSTLPELPHFVEDLFVRFPDIQFLTLNRLVPPAPPSNTLEEEFLTPKDFLALARILSLMNARGRTVLLMNEPLVNVLSTRLGMPALPESKVLDRSGDLMIRADLSLTLSHANPMRCGTYAPGAIEMLRSNARYRQALAPDTTVCPTCRHFRLCRSRGLERPVVARSRGRRASYFCRDILDRCDKQDASRSARGCTADSRFMAHSESTPVQRTLRS